MESGGFEDPRTAVGDNGASRGPYQIQRGYYNDAVEWNPSLLDGGRSYKNVMGPGSYCYSRKVMQSYMDRYATEGRIGHPVTDEDIARIHNGGPYGYMKDSSRPFWDKVKTYLDKIKRQSTC